MSILWDNFLINKYSEKICLFIYIDYTYYCKPEVYILYY